MGQIVVADFDTARLDPERVFASPDEVVAQRWLTRQQKITALERWKDCLKDRLTATGEGMAPPPGETAREAATIEAIAMALATLNADGDEDHRQ